MQTPSQAQSDVQEYKHRSRLTHVSKSTRRELEDSRDWSHRETLNDEVEDELEDV